MEELFDVKFCFPYTDVFVKGRCSSSIVSSYRRHLEMKNMFTVTGPFDSQITINPELVTCMVATPIDAPL